MAFPTYSSPRRQLTVLVALFAAWSIAYADRIVMASAIVPIAQEFGLANEAKGWVLGSFYLSYALMQLGGGWLSDRYGSRRVLVGCLVAWSLFTASTGAAWSLASLIAIRLLFGFGEGSFAPASAGAITETFPPSRRARVQALMSGTVFLGAALGSAAVAWIIQNYGWRACFHMLGAAGMAIAVGLWWALPQRPAAGAQAAAASGAAVSLPWRSLARLPGFWRICAIWFGISILSIGLQSWMPSYLMRELGVDMLHAGLISVIPLAASFIGILLVGMLIDRGGPALLKPLMATGALLSALCLALMTTTRSLPYLIAYWTLFGLAFDMVYATVFAIPLKYFPAGTAGRTTGMINFCGQLAGTMAPVAMGHLITLGHGSYQWAFLLLSAAGVFAFLMAVTGGFGEFGLVGRDEHSRHSKAPIIIHLSEDSP